MSKVIKFPVPPSCAETLLLKNLPKNLPTFIFTGYTDLRKSIDGLCQIIRSYDRDPELRMMSFFCGRRSDRFKILLYEADGYLLMLKKFDERRLQWPRDGGTENGLIWWIDNETLLSLMRGEKIPMPAPGLTIKIPKKNTEPQMMLPALFSIDGHLLTAYILSGYTDLRKSIDGLVKIAEQEYGIPTRDDVVLAFCGKRADRIKVIWHDGDGYIMFVKRLEAERFHWPRERGEMWKLMTSSFYQLMCGEEMRAAPLRRIQKRAPGESPPVPF